jgi:hypothetical protein
MSVRRSQEELTVLTKSYDLILWSCHHTGRFPRNHRFVLGERIERNLYDLLETLIRANYTRQRQELLEQANLLLEILRFQLLEILRFQMRLSESCSLSNGPDSRASKLP